MPTKTLERILIKWLIRLLKRGYGTCATLTKSIEWPDHACPSCQATCVIKFLERDLKL